MALWAIYGGVGNLSLYHSAISIREGMKRAVVSLSMDESIVVATRKGSPKTVVAYAANNVHVISIYVYKWKHDGRKEGVKHDAHGSRSACSLNVCC